MIFFRFLALCVFVLMIGCGKNLEPKPEPITDPKLESKSAVESAPNKENKKNDGILDVRVGESFDYGDLSITVIDVLNRTEIWGMNTALIPTQSNPLSYDSFYASPVYLKFKNIGGGRIEHTPGFGLSNSKISLEDEFGNKFEILNRFFWKFPFPNKPIDTGLRLDPNSTVDLAVYFENIPTNSKSFVLTMRLGASTVCCKGILGKATRLENQKEEQDLIAAKEKKEQDLIAAKEKEKQLMITTEANRKKDFESKNLTYYPSPVTKYNEKTADQWHKILIEAVSNNYAREAKESFDSLKALNDEGVPYLVDFLVRQSTPQGRELALIHLYACKIHPNDLPKIVDCLNKTKNQISARVMALNILSRSGNAKPYYSKIQPMVVDLLMNKNVKDSVKEYLDKINN